MIARAIIATVLSLVAPVDTPVTRPFEQPACTWCPGHRGLRFDTPVGTAVVAPASGTVVFAGSVAGRRWLTVRVGDLRVTVGPLATVLGRTGSTVRAGQPVGRSGDHVLLTVRQGDGSYLDPATLLVADRRRPRLVPLGGVVR